MDLSEIPKEVPGAFLAMTGSGDRTKDPDEIPVNFQVSSRQSRCACVVPDDQGIECFNFDSLINKIKAHLTGSFSLHSAMLSAKVLKELIIAIRKT